MMAWVMALCLGQVPVELTEERVVEWALAAHPSIEAAQALRDAAQAEAAAAARDRIPDVRLSAHYSRLSDIPAGYRSFDGIVFPQLLDNVGGRVQVNVALTDTFLGLAATARAAGHAAEAAELDRVSQRAQIAYEARVAFLSYWSRSLALANAQERLRTAEESAADQQRRAAEGTVARSDVLPFALAADEARMALATAHADVDSSAALLRSYIPQHGAEPWATPTSLPELAACAPNALLAGQRDPPRLAAMAAQAQSAEARADAALWARFPVLRLYGFADLSAPNPRVFVLDRLLALPSWEAGVQFEWSLGQLTSGGARLEAARQQQRALAARVEETRLKLEAERATIRALLTAAQSRLELASQQVAHAEELTRARHGELDAGTALPLNVVTAEADLLRAKNDRVDAFVQRAVAFARWDFMQGYDHLSQMGTAP